MVNHMSFEELALHIPQIFTYCSPKPDAFGKLLSGGSGKGDCNKGDCMPDGGAGIPVNAKGDRCCKMGMEEEEDVGVRTAIALCETCGVARLCSLSGASAWAWSSSSDATSQFRLSK